MSSAEHEQARTRAAIDEGHGPQTAEDLFRRGQQAFAEGSCVEALALLEAAIRLGPSPPNASNLAGWILGSPDADATQRLFAALERRRGTAAGERLIEVLRGFGCRVDSGPGLDPDSSSAAFLMLAAPLTKGEVWTVGDVVVAACRKALTSMATDAWSTDEDEIGVALLELGDSPGVCFYPLPFRFPIQRTEGAGMRREFLLRARVPEGCLCSLAVPFSDRRGWGEEQDAYVFSLETRCWSLVTRAPVSPGYKLSPLPGELLEAPTDSLCCAGGLIVHRDVEPGSLLLEADLTPYHLDNWQHDPHTSQALAEEASLRSEQRATECEVKAMTPYDWQVSRAADGAPLAVVRHARSYALLRESRLAPAEVAKVEPLAAAICGSCLVLFLRLRRADGTPFDSAIVLQREAAS